MEKTKVKILIDNGHGSNTSGKCSPDGSHKEYKWAREMARRIDRKLTLLGYDSILLTPEEEDVSLRERCRRAQAWGKKLGFKNVVVISIHNDACPDNATKSNVVEKGRYCNWHTARGFSARVSLNASQNSKRLARLLVEEAEKRGLWGNRSVPACKYWAQNLAICRDHDCPAVLTENLFMDNKEDLAYLRSEVGMEAIADMHVAALMKYIEGL